MKPRSSSLTAPRSSATAFTLMELMVVMVVISILAAIAVPSFNQMVIKAKKKQALNDANQLKMAIGSFYTEYRRYPIRNLSPESPAQPHFSDHALMDILIPSDKEAGPGGMNRRRHSMASFRRARPMGRGKYRAGVKMDETGAGELWDPWGNYYRVVMDTNYDNRIASPPFDGKGAIMQSVIVWSPGDDGDDATLKDNVMTWRP